MKYKKRLGRQLNRFRTAISHKDGASHAKDCSTTTNQTKRFKKRKHVKKDLRQQSGAAKEDKRANKLFRAFEFILKIKHIWKAKHKIAE